MLMLPSDDPGTQSSVAAEHEVAKWSNLWYLGRHTVSTLQASELSGQWHTRSTEHVGCHLTAYELSALSVGVYRALLRVSSLCSDVPCFLIASQILKRCPTHTTVGYDTSGLTLLKVSKRTLVSGMFFELCNKGIENISF